MTGSLVTSASPSRTFADTAAYAAVSTDVLTDSQTADTLNNITYNNGTYSATVDATQTKTKWKTDQTEITIGGKAVTVNALNGWTITGNVETGTVTIEEKTAD